MFRRFHATLVTQTDTEDLYAKAACQIEPYRFKLIREESTVSHHSWNPKRREAFSAIGKQTKLLLSFSCLFVVVCFFLSPRYVPSYGILIVHKQLQRILRHALLINAF